MECDICGGLDEHICECGQEITKEQCKATTGLCELCFIAWNV